jgi:hypothetical protein
VVDVFPEPAAVGAAYTNDLESAAAMQVLARTLEDKIGKPPTANASPKISRYQAAWLKINPQSRAHYTSRLDTIDKLRRSKQFTVNVLQRFVPVYAIEAGTSWDRNDTTPHSSPIVNDSARRFSP